MRFCRSLTVNISVTKSAASSINKTAEAYSKVNKYAIQSSFKLTLPANLKKELLKFSKYMLLPTWISCYGSLSSVEVACALPNSLKKLLFHRY